MFLKKFSNRVRIMLAFVESVELQGARMSVDVGPLWNDDEFRRRVTRLAQQRGKSLNELCTRAGLSASYLSKSAPRSGRSVEALMRISRELQVSLFELIGTSDRHDAAPTDDNLSRVALVAEIAATLYIALGARSEIPTGFDAIGLVSQILSEIERRPPNGNQR